LERKFGIREPSLGIHGHHTKIIGIMMMDSWYSFWTQVGKRDAKTKDPKHQGGSRDVEPMYKVPSWCQLCYITTYYIICDYHTLWSGSWLTRVQGPGTNEFKQSYWSKALNWSQGL
jgi:hypothetical protein